VKIPEPFSVVARELEEVEALSKKLLDSKVRFVLKAGRYIIDSGGKRVRPGLTLLCGKLFGAQPERLIPVATVMEYMHTATLLHDDVVDGAKLRRSKPTAGVVFGNDIAVLVGDYMFAKAIHVLAVHGGEEVLKVSAETVQHMAEGEILQLEKIGDVNMTEQEYMDIVFRKTASLMSTCCEVGAILGRASQRARATVKDFGKLVGYAFQLVDDAFDYASSQETIGKPSGNDIREGKVTYPLLCVLKSASRKERELIAQVLTKANPTAEEVEAVRELVLRKGGVKETLKLAKGFVARAKESISNLPESPFKTALKSVADFVVARTH